MNRAAINLIALLAAVALSMAAAAGGRTAATRTAGPVVPVVDASGVAHAPGDYRRVASLAILSDSILIELLEPERLVAVSAWSVGPMAFKLGGRPRLRGADELERILALKPDLVVVAGGGSAAVARLRQAGIAVYDLGDLTGWEHCARTIRDFGRLLRVEDRAALLLAGAEARLAAVAARPLAKPPRAVWVAVVGDRLYGGTTGTSFHDLLVRAGCDDAAAGRYRAWPEYSAEDLIALDADLIVTGSRQEAELRGRAGVGRLRARIIELPEAVAGDPGLGLVDAVEALRAALER